MDKTNDIFGEYTPEKTQYKQYDGLDAAETVIPTEVNPSYKDKQDKGNSRFSPARLGEAFLDFSENLGEFYISVFKSTLLKISPVLVMPFKYIIKALVFIYRCLDSFKDKSLRHHLNKRWQIRRDLKHLHLMTLKQEDENKTSYFFKALKKYFISLLPGEKELFKRVFSCVFPLAVLCLIATTFIVSNNKVFALKLMYKDSLIGYAENQSVYNESKNMLSAMFSDENIKKDLLSNISFSLEKVDPINLSSSHMISEAMLACSSGSYKRACAIYIDGVFLCAITNESDALSVFSSVLAPYEKNADSNTTVGFVEEIEYIQGYYAEDSEKIWDSAKLREYLEDENTCPVRVKVMKTRTKTQTVKYETVKKNTSTLYKGTKKTTQKGKNGKAKVTELITYIDSKKTYTGIISETVIQEPVDEIVLIGTKSNASASSYAPSKSFIWPTRGAYSISSYYGYRSASISGWSYHGGLDIVLGYGSSAGIPVVASASGTVVTAYSGWRGYGHTVVIDHGGGIKTRYAHMYPGSITVRVGQKVYQGQQIGRIGSTGNSTGPHLHFEVLVNGYKVNPLPYIR